MKQVLKQKQYKGKNTLDRLIGKINIEKRLRSCIDSTLIYSHYIVDYLIVWIITGLSVQTYQLPQDKAFAVSIARIVMALLFIIVQHPIFFLISKLVVLGRVVVVKKYLLIWEGPCLVFELLMVLVWVLTKQQRQIHSDSKIGYSLSFYKQTLIYILILIDTSIKSLDGTIDKRLILIFFVAGILVIDLSEFYYSKKFKNIVTTFDKIQLVFAIFTLVDSSILQLESYVFYSVVLIVIIMTSLTTSLSFDKIYKTSLRKLEAQDDQYIAQYWIQLKRLTEGDNIQAIYLFIQKTKSQTNNQDLSRQFSLLEESPLQIKKQQIHQLILNSLKNASKHSETMRDLLIYMFSPNPQIFAYLDFDCWHHRREYFRILDESNHKEPILRDIEHEQQKIQTKIVLAECVQSRDNFFKGLMRQNVHQIKILSLGEQLIKKMDEFLEEYENRENLDSSRILGLYNFSQMCLGPYFSNKFDKQSISAYYQTEADPYILIGIRHDQKYKICQTSRSFNKFSLFKLDSLRKLTISQIFGPEQNILIKNMVDSQLSKQLLRHHQFEHEIKIGWFFNSKGYVVVCQLHLQNSHFRFQQCLKIFMKPLFIEKAVLLISEKGQIKGISELATHFNLSPKHLKSQINYTIFNELLKNHSYKIQQNDSLIDGRLLFIKPEVLIQIIQKEYCQALGEYVLVVEMANPQRKGGNINTSMKNSFQFYANWKGKISNKPLPLQLPPDVAADQPTITKKYGENIIQMRLYDNKLDFKVNFNQARQCQSLPQSKQEDFDDILQQAYHEKISRKKEVTPIGLKISYGILILLMILSIFKGLYLLIDFQAYSTQNTNNFNYICKTSLKMESLTMIGLLTVFPKFGLSQNHTQLIMEHIAIASKLSNEMYQLNPNIIKIPQGQEVLLIDKEFNRLINNYLVDPSIVNQQMAIYSLTNITLSYVNYSFTIVGLWQQEFNAFKDQAQIRYIVLVGIEALFVFVLIGIEYKMIKRKEQIMDVLKSIDNQALAQLSAKVQNFKSAWIQNGDQRQQIDEQQKQIQNFTPKKRVRRQSQFTMTKAFYLLWLVLNSILVPLFLLSHLTDMNTASVDYFNLANYNEKSLSIYHTVLSYMVIAPYFPFIMSFIFPVILSNDFYRNDYYHKLMTHQNVHYNEFYSKFWNGPQFCSYINQPDCPTILGIATSDGGNMVLNFLTLKMDQYVSVLGAGGSIYTQADIKTTGRILYFYIFDMIEAVNNALVVDYENFIMTTTEIMIFYIALGMLIALMLLLFIWHLKRYFAEMERQEDILLTLPFEKLKSKGVFHKFYEKHYAHY